MPPGSPHICAVMASDSAFFHQTQAAVDSIRAAGGSGLDIRLITLGPLLPHQLEWLATSGIRVHDRLDDFPRFPGSPAHTVAMTCRPYLPQVFSDVDGIMWIDSDIRFLHADGLAQWTARASNAACPVAAAQETEPAYIVNWHPEKARLYHEEAVARLQRGYGPELAGALAYYKMFNAGLFAMPVQSPVWRCYREHLERALALPYDRMREQDAFNLAILECGVTPMPATLNWLCSLSMPVRDVTGAWVSPRIPHHRIDVVHLTNSNDVFEDANPPCTGLELYRRMGLTA